MACLNMNSRRGALKALLGGSTISEHHRAPGGGRIRRLGAVALIGLALCVAALGAWGANDALSQEPVGRLALEVRGQGWIVYGARSERGDWDLFACRPDGSALHPLTRTPDFNEITPQVSRDGRRLLYRRVKRSEKPDNNRHGEQGELVVANSDGTNPQVLGGEGEFPWASWSTDGRQIASLSIRGIAIIDVASKQVVRRLERKGFFQQLTWSPDGQWLVGVANSYGTGWSIARMNVATGAAEAVNRVDCCTPDWFPDSRSVIFSWRPPGQKTNNGYGWTQLWMADAEGKSRQLVYGEDGRHVYGGNVSPDGKYVLFTGNLQEDGDPGNAGAPMGLMRLSDAPIIGGESKELRGLHPKVNDGPVLTLPAGWEPCWTLAEIGSLVLPSAQGQGTTAKPGQSAEAGRSTVTADDRAGLSNELHNQGWIVYSARTEQGDWDLYLMRPDGSERRALTDTREFNEAGPRFSPDGKRLLYYRLPKGEAVNMTYGTHELVIADADGRNPVVYGSEFPWASWGPDSTQIACLKPNGIQIVDLSTRKVVRQLPRQNIAQQLVWSPDGHWFLGTANDLGPYWNIGRLNPTTGIINSVSEVDRYNCTPDWAPDSQHVVYARGIIPEKGGRAEMWWASGDGKERKMLFAEEGRHIYGACVSPHAEYCLFTRSADDFGNDGDVRGFTMAIMRRRDAPMIGDDSASLRKRFPEAKSGPWLDLGPGWEPHWTAAEVKAAQKP
jgi:Tol biopolymer transport system component